MKPPNEKEAGAQENTPANGQTTFNTNKYGLFLVAAKSLLGRLRIVSEEEAEALLGERTPCIEIVHGLPVFGLRTPRGRFIPAREVISELGDHAVTVPGEAWPVWFIHWALGTPEEFIAHHGSMSDEEIVRLFPGFDRAKHDRWLADHRASWAAQDAHILAWLAERLAEALS